MHGLENPADARRTISKQAKRFGTAKPKPAPKLRVGLAWYLESFSELDTCRQIENAPIPFVAITAYASHHGLEGDDIDDLMYYVRSMDNAFLKHSIEKQRREMKANAKPSGPGTRHTRR